MKRKWKIVIVSILIYQVILTLMLLKLAHYSHWLYFGGSGSDFPMHWYEGLPTAPMRESVIWLGVVFGIFLIWNIIEFRKDKKRK